MEGGSFENPILLDENDDYSSEADKQLVIMRTLLLLLCILRILQLFSELSCSFGSS
jgi:hypothetical protein